MIQGLYETHLDVENLERSITFYSEVLGLKQCRFDNDRRLAFFWVGEDRQQMLGLWEKPKDQIEKRHFAFKCDPEWIANESIDFLKSHGLNYWNFLQDDNDKPMVFVWVPAIAIYFTDPDGHYLEFLGLLDGNTQPDEEHRIVSYEEWLELNI